MRISKEVGFVLSLPQKGTVIELKGTCPAEGCVRRHHPQLHAAIGPPQLNSSAETFHPLQAATGETSATGTPTNHVE